MVIAGLNQEQLARLVGYKQQSVSRWIRGESRPGEKAVHRLEAVLVTEPGALLAAAGYSDKRADLGRAERLGWRPSTAAHLVDADVRRLEVQIRQMGPVGRRLMMNIAESILDVVEEPGEQPMLRAAYGAERSEEATHEAEKIKTRRGI